ncbi:MAG: peptidoglycan DD-metalloendopeptidase family protein [Candidatus Magasanikbacteria bacterium]|nr:peptidoglycan DD-metalloendopeptidase family protein [Candidatus Magasanikbacteria bacterium]
MQPLFVSSENVGGNKAEVDALNQQIAEKKEKIKQLEASISEYKKQIEVKKSEAVSLSNQIAILDNYLVQTELDIQATQEKLETLSLEIESLEFSIDEKSKVIDRQKEILSELIKTIYYENNKKYIEVAAAYENFSDFYNRVHYVKNLERDLGKSAKTIRLAKEDLEDKKVQTEERKKSYEEVKKKLDNRKKDLYEQSQYKEVLLTQTKSSEATYKTLLSNLNAQYKAIENEIIHIEQEVRKKLEAQNKFSGETNATQLSWPTQSRYITAYFYDKSYPYRYIFEHNAVDIRASHGTPVKAAASGYVARAKFCTTASCYAYIMLVHSDGISTVYGHLSQISVIEDQFVTRGDVIGYSGATPGTIGAGPFTTGAHVHFEVRKNGIPVNPLNYLVKDWE